MKSQSLDAIKFERDYQPEAQYQQSIKERQTKLLQLQRAVFHQKHRVIFAFEGWDAAGKGGAIRHLTELLDPRGVRVHSISAPSAEEQGKHYLFRFWDKLPAPGHIAIFDRTWYGRVLVERVEKLCSEKEWSRAYQEINEFERTLTDDGIILVKIFLHISKDEQKQRFLSRLLNPLKHWKMTPDDLRNRKKWSDYTLAINEMFAKTDLKQAPWHLIPANHKAYTRAKTLKIACDTLHAKIDDTAPLTDGEWVRDAIKALNAENS